MARKDILPAVSAFESELASEINEKEATGLGLDCAYEKETLQSAAALSAEMYADVKALEAAEAKTAGIADALELAKFYRSAVLPAMHLTPIAALANTLRAD